MWSDHVFDILLIVGESLRVVFVDGPQSFEAVNERLVWVDVTMGTRSLHPNQPGKMRNTL